MRQTYRLMKLIVCGVIAVILAIYAVVVAAGLSIIHLQRNP